MDNTNNEILYSSVEEQIEKLKQQNLIIEDEDFAQRNISKSLDTLILSKVIVLLTYLLMQVVCIIDQE